MTCSRFALIAGCLSDYVNKDQSIKTKINTTKPHTLAIPYRSINPAPTPSTSPARLLRQFFLLPSFLVGRIVLLHARSVLFLHGSVHLLARIIWRCQLMIKPTNDQNEHELWRQAVDRSTTMNLGRALKAHTPFPGTHVCSLRVVHLSYSSFLVCLMFLLLGRLFGYVSTKANQ